MMEIMDWFKKAKEAKKKKEKPEYGQLGSKQKAYKEAQDALKQHEEMASDE